MVWGASRCYESAQDDGTPWSAMLETCWVKQLSSLEDFSQP